MCVVHRRSRERVPVECPLAQRLLQGLLRVFCPVSEVIVVDALWILIAVRVVVLLARGQQAEIREVVIISRGKCSP